MSCLGLMMTEQLTSLKVCMRKHAYKTNKAAVAAKKRRNKAAGYKYLRQYKCNMCAYWHVTSESKELPAAIKDMKV